MSDFTQVSAINDGASIALTTPDGNVRRFHALWLRDNAFDEHTRSAANGQKLHELSDLSAATRIRAVKLDASGNLSVTFSPDGHSTTFSGAWLVANCYDTSSVVERGSTDNEIRRWDVKLTDSVPSADYHQLLNDDDTLHGWLESVAAFGVAKVTAGPTTPQSLLRIAERFGYVRETNYGKWFEVRTETNPTNLAYTRLGLQPHTDNPYRDPVPTLQILYCLENSTDGGDSLIVDGFNAAQRLHAESPDFFDLLTRYNARFEYAGTSDVSLTASKPMLELSLNGELKGIRFNNRSCTAITDVPFDHMSDYYAAYRRLSEIINDPANAVQFRLTAGDSFIVDNTRVLHGRTAYTSVGTRWLQGCYPDKDGLLSTLRILNASKQSNH